MNSIQLDLDGCYAMYGPLNQHRHAPPSRYAEDVAAAFPDLGPCGLADIVPVDGPSRGIEAEPLPSYKVRSRITTRRQKKARRR